jgi:hypothetical protein
MKKSDEQQGREEASASDPHREGWRRSFDGDLIKAQERFRRVAKLYEDTTSAAMLNRASFNLVGFLSAEYGMDGLEDDFRKELQRERKARSRRRGLSIVD